MQWSITLGKIAGTAVQGSPVFGAFGHMNASKRVPQLLRAFARFRVAHPESTRPRADFFRAVLFPHTNQRPIPEYSRVYWPLQMPRPSGDRSP